jgi:hypothetical protein
MPHLLRKIGTYPRGPHEGGSLSRRSAQSGNKGIGMTVFPMGEHTMPRRTKPQGKPRMSREALEALAVSVARRIEGLDAVSLAIMPMERDDAGRNWDISLAAEAPCNEVCARIRDALAPWRDRFDLVS